MRVLVVEDNLRMATMLERGLREEGYSVDVTSDGIKALRQATDVDYDALVLDVMLPGLDGLDLCRRLRAADRWVPILMLTARAEVGDRVHGLDAGADDYLAKPFSFTELCARLRALVRRGAPERPTILTAGDLRLDMATHDVRRGSVFIALSAKEFSLLELMLRRRGEVVSRTQILDHVWDFAYSGVSKVVDQYVALLRRKIDRPFGVTQLETVRGVGYRLRDTPIPDALLPADSDRP
ncbi:MAG: response regulator transcription factor [Nakamurella sp.]